MTTLHIAIICLAALALLRPLFKALPDDLKGEPPALILFCLLFGVLGVLLYVGGVVALAIGLWGLVP